MEVIKTIVMLIFHKFIKFSTKPFFLHFYCILKRQDFSFFSNLMVIVRISPINRVPEKNYQFNVRQALRNPSGGMRMKNIPGGCFSSNEIPFLNLSDVIFVRY